MNVLVGFPASFVSNQYSHRAHGRLQKTERATGQKEDFSLNESGLLGHSRSLAMKISQHHNRGMER
jgi:hypothetical protein